MITIEKAFRMIDRAPESPDALLIADLLRALESRLPFDLRRLYEIDRRLFDMGVEILIEWRLAQYFGSLEALRRVLNLPSLPVPALPAADAR